MGESISLHDVLRYLLERVSHSTQEDHDRIAAAIDHDENGAQTAPDAEEENA